jgi:hypothetical protein
MTNRRRSRVALALGLAAWAGAARAAEPAAADDRALVALAVALACSDVPPSTPAPAPPAEAPPRGAGEGEVVLVVRARALGLAELPQPDAVVPPAIARRIAWSAERVNLPARPEPGVVYENVELRLTIRAAPEDLAALLAAARGASSRVVLVAQPAR